MNELEKRLAALEAHGSGECPNCQPISLSHLSGEDAAEFARLWALVIGVTSFEDYEAASDRLEERGLSGVELHELAVEVAEESARLRRGEG